MRRAWQSGLGAVLVALLAAAAFGQVTRGFRCLTSEGARRIDLARAPRPLPAIELVDSAGRRRLLADGAGQATLVTLVYTHCVTICRAGASGQAYLQQEIRARGLDLRLLTLSFDPARDTPQVLAAYASRLGAGDGWTVATVARAADLAALLKLFGVVLLADGQGGYSHNGALFLVDAQGRLARAYDIDRPDTALADCLPARGC